MDDTGYGLLILGGLVLFDLLIAAIRGSLSQTNLTRLFSQREPEEGAGQRMAEFTQKAAALDVGLLFLRLLCWFLAAGILLALPGIRGMDQPSQGVLLALFVLFFFYLEQSVEANIAHRAEVWVVRLAGITRILGVILTPLTWLALRIKSGRNGSLEAPESITEDELITLLDASQQEGMLEPDEREMIYSIFRLSNTLVREIMVPRIYITALDVNTSLTEAADALLNSGHSRAPVYEDTIDNIVGLIYAKDLLRAWRENTPMASLRSLLREVYFVPEAKKVDELLDEMQARQVHMAIVVDEYGGVAGLVTMEDIVEEIVGEIRDEYDEMEELPYQVVGPGEYLVQGRIDLDDFNELLQVNLPRDEAETLSGFVYNRVGRVPENGEKVLVDDVELTVEQVIGRRIRKVRARRLPQPSSHEPEQEETNAEA